MSQLILIKKQVNLFKINNFLLSKSKVNQNKLKNKFFNLFLKNFKISNEYSHSMDKRSK